MRTSYYKRILVCTIAGAMILTTPFSVQAQSSYKTTKGKDASIKVSGKSNVHDWDMSSSVMESQGEFKFDKNNNLNAMSGFIFNVEARSLKSGNRSMDGRTYKAMKADQFPKIMYKLSSAVISQVNKNNYKVKSTGDLTIAGATKSILMDLNVLVNADRSITCSGSENLKLTDYQIQPPSFMLGAMKVKNDLNIAFNLIYRN